MKMNERNLSMLADFYQFTMSHGYFRRGYKDKVVVFDMFYRKTPDGGGYAVSAGLSQVIDYIKNIKFTKKNIRLLKKKGITDEKFLEYLLNFKFRGDIYAVPEGTIVFPNEPMITVVAPIVDAQLIETMVLLIMNHQSLIATKTTRIVKASQGRGVMEFGSRRAQGFDGAVYGARSAYIAGAIGTSNVLAEEMFGVPALGTMAHSWVQYHDTEYEAFKVYAEEYPDNCTLLVDTYNVLKSGIPNAIKVFNEVVVPAGYRPKGIRLDSGDLTYLSKKVRKMLDDAGFEDCKIVASNSLDEEIIESLIAEGAKIDIFGVGERLITSKSTPVFGGVYKLAGVFSETGEIIPKIKLSEDDIKITNPSFKKTIRFYDKETNKAVADVIMLKNEKVSEDEYMIQHETKLHLKKTLKNYYTKELQVPIFLNGELVYQEPTLEESREYAKKELDTMWDEVKRFKNPHLFIVDLSEDLKALKKELKKEFGYEE